MIYARYHNLRYIALFLMIFALAGCATRADRVTAGFHDAAPEEFAAGPRPSLEDVAAAYTNTCACGVRLSNNCTHYLSDAFIRAGYKELQTDKMFTTRCEAGRPIRAQELLRWFQEQADGFSETRPDGGTGMWAVYQEKPNRRHVTVIDMNTGIFYGTDDCKTWPVQWFYKW